MAANISFGDKTLTVQAVVDLLATELQAIKGNVTTLNETVTTQLIKDQTDTNLQETSMDLTMMNNGNLNKPNFDLVSAIVPFSGEENETLNEFFNRIDDVGKLSFWTESHKLLIAKLKLTGTALTFSKTDETCQAATTLEEFKNALEVRFKDNLPEHFYFEQLANVRQERGEAIERYADRVKLISNKTLKSTQNALVDQVLRKEADRRATEAFSRGLFGDLGYQVRIRFPKTFQEAVAVATAIRDVERRPSDGARINAKQNVFMVPQPPRKCRICNLHNHDETTCRYSSVPKFTIPHFAPPRFQPPRTPNHQTHKQCNFCKRMGHWESECRTKQRSVPKTAFYPSNQGVSMPYRQGSPNYFQNPSNLKHMSTNYPGGSSPAAGTSKQK